MCVQHDFARRWKYSGELIAATRVNRKAPTVRGALKEAELRDLWGDQQNETTIAPAIERRRQRPNVPVREGAGCDDDLVAHRELRRQSGDLVTGENYLTRLAPSFRLALEMSLHEADERAALEGELHVLEARWREAEEIAAISDGMFLPADIDERLDRLRER